MKSTKIQIATLFKLNEHVPLTHRVIYGNFRETYYTQMKQPGFLSLTDYHQLDPIQQAGIIHSFNSILSNAINSKRFLFPNLDIIGGFTPLASQFLLNNPIEWKLDTTQGDFEIELVVISEPLTIINFDLATDKIAILQPIIDPQTGRDLQQVYIGKLPKKYWFHSYKEN